MIEFKCQHCGKGLHLNDSYAGRDGWCRVCKRMVIVPGAGPVVRVEDLPPEEGYERLQRLLQYAATKADKYKVHLARQVKEQEHLARLEEALAQARQSLQERDTVEERYQGECEALRATLAEKEARLAEFEVVGASADLAATAALEAELGVLRADLALERESRQALAAALSEREVSLAALEAEVTALRSAALEHRGLEEAAAAERVNLRALEGAVSTLKSQLGLAEGERDRLASILEEGASGEHENALLIVQKDREIAGLHSTLSEMKIQQEESARSTRAQIVALEGQVLLFNEIKERMGGLQGRIKDLEQERLDTSLALDGAHQTEELLQKKVVALESAIRESMAEQAERESHSGQLQRDLGVRDEQIRKLTEELQALTEGHGSAELALEKSARAARSAESRAEHLASEVEALLRVRDEAVAENDQLRRGVAEMEARQTSLNESLAKARAEVLEKSAHEPVARELQVELSAARLELQRAEEDGAAAQASFQLSVTQLQAEVAHLSEALSREAARATEAEARITELAAASDHSPGEAALAQGQAALEAARARIAELEGELERREEQTSLQQVEEEHLAQSLSEARARITTLEAALEAAERSGSEERVAEDSDEAEDVGFILLSPESDGGGVSSPTVVSDDGVDERRRQLEKKQMMDVLSDFLSK